MAYAAFYCKGRMEVYADGTPLIGNLYMGYYVSANIPVGTKLVTAECNISAKGEMGIIGIVYQFNHRRLEMYVTDNRWHCGAITDNRIIDFMLDSNKTFKMLAKARILDTRGSNPFKNGNHKWIWSEPQLGNKHVICSMVLS